MDDSVSESDHSDDRGDEETLPGVYATSQVERSPRRKSLLKKSPQLLKHSPQQKSPGKSPSTSKAISPKQKTTVTQQSKQKASPNPARQKAAKAINGTTRQRTLDLGTFSDSSSESDEDVNNFKRSLLVKPIGGNTLMCLPNLSEYTRHHEDTQKHSQKSVSFKNKSQPDKKKKASNTKEITTAQSKANQKKKKATEVVDTTASEREDSESQTDNEARAVKTERNPKIKKRRSIAAAKKNTKAVQPSRKPASVAKVAVSCRSNKVGDQSDDSISDTSQKSFASLRNASSKIIETMYDNGDQELEHDITNDGGEKTRPNISFTSSGQSQRLSRSSVKQSQTANTSVTEPSKVVAPQSSRKRQTSSNDTTAQTKKQKVMDQRVAAQLPAESGDDKGHDVMPQKEAAKSKHKKSKGVNKNLVRIPPNKAKLKKKPSRQAKKMQLVQEVLVKNEAMMNGDDDVDGPRRSRRTRIPTLNRLLGEEVVYVASESGT